jgi:hypothetical protein
VTSARKSRGSKIYGASVYYDGYRATARYSALAEGGGICNEGSMKLVLCTIFGNTASDLKKYWHADDYISTYGGGIVNWRSMEITSCTIAGNWADIEFINSPGVINGAGLCVKGSGTSVVLNCIVSGNKNIIAHSISLSEDNLQPAMDVFGTDSFTLAENGGPTKTVAIPA